MSSSAQSFEMFMLRRPWFMHALHAIMILVYLALILIPPFLPTPPDTAGPFNNFTIFSHFVFWYVWWPFVVLSMIFFGRAWCGFLCPEGALSAYASRFGGSRPIPRWMKWGGIPLVAFIGITIYGQMIGVYEYAKPQLLILGGSTLLAIGFNLVYTRSGWVWCRYLCPVSLLFGVFSRLGSLHFRVDHERMKQFDETHEGAAVRKEPCPVFIHLPALSTNRYCLMCFRCADWKDSIHLGLRRPGAELMDISRREPLFWEVIFLFGAIGLPIGVFNWSISPLFQSVKEFLWEAGGLIGIRHILTLKVPWWVLCNYPESGEIFYVLDGAAIVTFILGATILSLGIFSLLTCASAFFLEKNISTPPDRKTLFTRIGYLYTPLSLFSLFLGLSQLTFGYFQQIGMDRTIVYAIRGAVLAAGVVWSLYIAQKIIRRHGVWSWPAYLLHVFGVGLIVAAWTPVLFG